MIHTTQGVALCYVVLPLQGVFTPQGLLTTHSSLLTDLQARLHPKSRSNSRQHSDDDLNDFAPDGRLIGFHSFLKVKGERGGGRGQVVELSSCRVVKFLSYQVVKCPPDGKLDLTTSLLLDDFLHCKVTTRGERSEN